MQRAFFLVLVLLCACSGDDDAGGANPNNQPNNAPNNQPNNDPNNTPNNQPNNDPDLIDPCEPENEETWFPDEDGDGFGVDGETLSDCVAPEGYSGVSTDCNDTNAEISPAAVEICDNIDNDCDGLEDNSPADATEWCPDIDGDGVGNAAVQISACEAPLDHVEDCGDCDDDNPDLIACEEGSFCSVDRACIPDGTCLSRFDCGENQICNDEGVCELGSPCGGEVLQALEPNLMLALDRSCSMNGNIGDSSKWALAVTALVSILEDFHEQADFGLLVFPDRNDTGRDNCGQSGVSCTQGVEGVPEPIAPDNQESIRDLLVAALDEEDLLHPGCPCTTPIDCAMAQAASLEGLRDPARANHVILITDGAQSCNSQCGSNNGTVEIIEGLHTEGIDTFVVGFGGRVTPRQLRRFAEAGGRVPDNEDGYFQADNGAELADALGDIIRGLSCEVHLETEPPRRDQITIFFDDVELSEDPDDGWQIDGQIVTFHGAACQAIRDEEVNRVDILFDCKG